MQYQQQVAGQSWINNQALQLAPSPLLATVYNAGPQFKNLETLENESFLVIVWKQYLA